MSFLRQNILTFFNRKRKTTGNTKYTNVKRIILRLLDHGFEQEIIIENILPIVQGSYVKRKISCAKVFSKDKSEDRLAFDLTLTICRAKWVGRLAHVIEDVTILGIYALQYALVERMYQYLGKPFNSRVLDDEVMKPYPQILPTAEGAYAEFIEGLVTEVTKKRGTK